MAAALDARRVVAAYGEDYGTRYFKYGPLMERKPRIMESVGLFLEDSPLLREVYGIDKKLVVDYSEVMRYLGAKEMLVRNLIYPLKDGEIKREDERSWMVVTELTRKGLKQFEDYKKKEGFEGFYVTAAIAARAPEYMVEKLLEVHAKIDRETGLVKAFTVIAQPLAVAIAEKELTCVVVESGHGNTQITPINSYPIREAIISLYRGGAEADAVAAEVLKDLGYGDLASDEKAVRRFKEEAGLVPLDLDRAVRAAKENPQKFSCRVKLSPLLEIDLEDRGWYRFLIGEVVFNPRHEIYESYKKRGVLNIRPTVVGDRTIEGDVPLSDAILQSISETPVGIHELLLKKVILSGGNFQWRVPEELKGVAVSAREKVEHMLRARGLSVEVRMTEDPQSSVWKGCVVWSLALPDSYLWDENRGEGWFKRGVHY